MVSHVDEINAAVQIVVPQLLLTAPANTTTADTLLATNYLGQKQPHPIQAESG